MPDLQSTVTAPAIILQRVAERNSEMEFSLDFGEKSATAKAPFVPLWHELLDNYMVAPLGSSRFRGRVWNLGASTIMDNAPRNLHGRMQLKDPETHQIIETLTSQALGLLFSSRDYITATPVGEDDPEKARLLGRLLMGLLEQPGVFRTHYQLFKNAFIFGTSIIEIGWETRSRSQLVTKPIFDETRRFVLGQQQVIDDVIYRDAPLTREVTLFDFYPDPAGTRIQHDMSGVGKRFRITESQALQLAEAGVYRRDGVRRAIDKGKTGRSESPSNADKAFEHLSTETSDKYGILTGFEFWGESPIRTADGASNRVITILNGEHVRSSVNPFIDGMIPFKEIVVNPLTDRFYGLSPAEVVRFLQDASDSYLMHTNHALNAAVRGPMLVGRALGGDPLRIKASKLDDMIPVRDIAQVGPVPRDYTALNLATQERIGQKQMMRESSGATDPLQGNAQSGRRTATEFSELVRLASQRVEMMVSIIEKDDYPWIGRTYQSRLKQFGSRDGFITSLNGEPLNVPFDAINVDADIRFVGSRQATSKFQRGAQFREAISTVATAMKLIPAMPDVFTRYLRDVLDIPDAGEIVDKAVGAVIEQQEREAFIGASSRGGSPSARGSQEQGLGTSVGATEREGQRMA